MDNSHKAGEMVTLTGADFPVLADPRGKTVREYGVYDLLGDGVAAPATFIIGRDGVIRWRHVGVDIADRPPADEILSTIQGLRVQ